MYTKMVHIKQSHNLCIQRWSIYNRVTTYVYKDGPYKTESQLMYTKMVHIKQSHILRIQRWSKLNA